MLREYWREGARKQYNLRKKAYNKEKTVRPKS
jgi:hypothetical protein